MPGSIVDGWLPKEMADPKPLPVNFRGESLRCIEFGCTEPAVRFTSLGLFVFGYCEETLGRSEDYEQN